MTIEEIRNHAKEKGVSEKRIDALIAELHPGENGELSDEESAQALVAIKYHVVSKEYVRSALETTKAIRNRRGKNQKRKDEEQ